MARQMYKVLALAAAVAALAAPVRVAGQGAAVSCTASLVTSFTPCLSFLASSNSTSPTPDCCRSLAALVNASTGCACLILTGGVPLGLGVPINRTLAVSLPRACGNTSVPLQCRDAAAAAAPQTPAPSPVADAPSSSSSLPPLPPATPAAEAPAPQVVEPTATPPVSQGQTRPMVLPSSAWRANSHASMAPALVLLVALGATLV